MELFVKTDKSVQLSVIDYCHKTLHLKWLTWFWICVCIKTMASISCNRCYCVMSQCNSSSPLITIIVFYFPIRFLHCWEALDFSIILFMRSGSRVFETFFSFHCWRATNKFSWYCASLPWLNRLWFYCKWAAYFLVHYRPYVPLPH